ncbi:MAG: YfhO family protein [Ignavibacteria bacterium]|nr:YfhO family protein [Ignavibacteria bacterium]
MKKTNTKQSSQSKVKIKEQKNISISELPFWVAGLVFLATTLIFFGEQLFGSAYFWEDFIRYVYPTQAFAAREALSGPIPFWNPFTFSGMPFIADIAVGFFYPLNRLLSLFVSGDGYLPFSALQILIVLHFFIAQISIYFLLRYWKISSVASIISSIAYAFSMLMVVRVIHPMIVQHFAWFPLVILFYLKGLEKKNIKYSIISGIILGLSMLAGHPQISLYEGLFLAFFFIVYFIYLFKNKENSAKGIIYFISCGVLPIIIASGIFLVQLLPSQELTDYSQRKEMSYEAASEGSLQLSQVCSAVVPKVFGYSDGSYKMDVPFYLKFDGQLQSHFFWETAFYFGIVILILGLFGISVSYKTKTGLTLLIIAIFGFLYSLGNNGFIHSIFYNLPFFSTFRNPARMMFFVLIAFCFFAGFGFDELWKKIKDSKTLLRFSITAAIPLFIAILVALGLVQSSFEAPAEMISKISSYGTTTLVFILLSYIIVFLMQRGLFKPLAAGFALAVLLFIDLYLAGASFNKSEQNPKELYAVDSQLKQMLQAKAPNDIFRVNMRMYEPIRYRVMEDNQGMIDKIMLFEGYNQLMLERTSPPIEGKQIKDLLNIKYEIGFDSVRNSAAFFERPDYFPRCWLAYQVIESSSEAVGDLMKNTQFDYTKQVVLEKAVSLAMPDSLEIDSSDYAVCLEYENNYIKYKVKNKTNAVLVFSEVWYPAWNGYIDGKQTEVLRANYCLRAIPIPAGEHQVELKFESSAFSTGFLVSALTLGISLLGLVFLQFFGKRKE